MGSGVKQDDASKSSMRKKLSFFSKKKKSSEKTNQRSASDKSAVNEFADRAEYDKQAYDSAQRKSRSNLVALAYQTTTSKSFRDKGRVTSVEDSGNDAPLEKRGFCSIIFTGSTFFQKMCDDVFESIDVDKSGKIDQGELYQGLLLIHLKLGLYFGPAACKPLSADRAQFIFNKLDANRDGSLDKDEFRNVLALLMGNVVTRIIFQFVCTLLIVPFAAAALVDFVEESNGYIHSFITESLMPAFQDIRPLLEIALGWDLIVKYTSMAVVSVTSAVDKVGIADLVEGPMELVAEKFDDFILQPISEIDQDIWDDLPLTFVSTALTVIIVPYSILKTDDFFRFLAHCFGKKSDPSK